MDNLQEATPKSTREKMLRRTRPKKLTPRSKSFVGRVMPKKKGNNDPRRGGNRIHNELKESIVFLGRNLDKSDKELQEAVNNFEYKKSLLGLVTHMIAVGIDEWKELNGRYVSSSGVTASPRLWTLMEDGHLRHKYRKEAPRWDLGKLNLIRSYCERTRNTEG